MTVSELIEALKAMPPDALVATYDSLDDLADPAPYLQPVLPSPMWKAKDGLVGLFPVCDDVPMKIVTL